MNKQLKLNKDGSIKGRGIEWCDFTSNPISGCFHACSWKMPDNSIANCYAEDVADRVAQKAYPEGFEHHYWNPDEFEHWKKLPAGSKVFVGSMADVFGHWVPESQILQTLKEAAKYPAVTFQFLTKNPRRVRMFTDLIPRNCWIGASTPPDSMWNKPLGIHKRQRLLSESLETLFNLRQAGVTTWISAEPLTIDVGMFIKLFVYDFKARPIDWMVIGAASNGRIQYAPKHDLVVNAVRHNDQFGISTFFKGNLKSLQWAADNWREEFPLVTA